MARWLLTLLAAGALGAGPVHASSGSLPAVAGTAGAVNASLALAALDHVRWRGGGFPAHAFVLDAHQRAAASRFGPFRVIDGVRAEMVGATDADTPAQFAAMLRLHPGLRQIDMVDCPGTYNDRANLKLGRMIRAAGLAMQVPSHGSVRSGAVDLFLAGRERRLAAGARFAVHSWQDAHGREARHFAADAAPNRQYLDYYRDMGMSDGAARAFYAFTNSVSHAEALWLSGAEMARWLPEGGSAPAPAQPPRWAGGPVDRTGAAGHLRPVRIELQLAWRDPHGPAAPAGQERTATVALDLPARL
ncbi:hypothetical protein EYB45_10945 [Erythrobacteraceae bacterium CFH 75059]|uniref:hypothetical protein n=1 Tax=Qipengyuania thermophila TaxID=2509361 RepID=UPI0010229665|nr:hypothetical protein [Qipengyuania thermophila]TCD01932.1 hypothetical protein EYB45_10945 [Erythrobacteraceae bacterium CFH 75059]